MTAGRVNLQDLRARMEGHFRETYDALHEELTPEQLAAARTVYDVSSSW